MRRNGFRFFTESALCLVFAGTPCLAAEQNAAEASTTAESYTAAGAIDGNRFEGGEHAWRGRTGEQTWWWQARFAAERDVGAILQINGDDAAVLNHAPRKYVWQTSVDGRTWKDLTQTRIDDERRLIRVHRLRTATRCRYARLQITAATGEAPTLREVEFYARPDAKIELPEWIVVVDTAGDPRVIKEGGAFIPLAKSCDGYEQLQAQHVRLPDFNRQFLLAEPRPLCALLSGNFKDWCQQNREDWRGTQEILNEGALPIWASCGGAQGLAILAETGVDRPWDCPHCRDPLAPKLPIYTHIGHTGEKDLKCGDYSACKFERGPSKVRKVVDDPVFAGLDEQFETMESHCGQIEWPPAGWTLIATAGDGGLTKTQCLRVNDRPIYAAQFHIELDGKLPSSRVIMSNFLRLAKEWGGYKPTLLGKPAVAPGKR